MSNTKVPIEITDNKYLDKIIRTPNAVHQGVVLEVKPKKRIKIKEYLKSLQKNKDLIIALDQITDPQNVGAIIRSGVAFGASAILVPKDNSFQENAVLAKASSGYIENITFIEATNLAGSLEDLKKDGYWIVGLDGKSDNIISDANKFEKKILVLGAEGKGLRRLTQEQCDMLCKIKMKNGVESLNVSNAAAISLYELGNNNEK